MGPPGMVGICQSAAAWQFATGFAPEDLEKWSGFSCLPQPGIFRPQLGPSMSRNGRDLPACCSPAVCDHNSANRHSEMVAISHAVLNRQFATGFPLGRTPADLSGEPLRPPGCAEGAVSRGVLAVALPNEAEIVLNLEIVRRDVNKLASFELGLHGGAVHE